jgi:hypothetical protein
MISISDLVREITCFTHVIGKKYKFVVQCNNLKMKGRQGILLLIACNKTRHSKNVLVQLYLIIDTVTVWKHALEDDFIKSKHVVLIESVCFHLVVETDTYRTCWNGLGIIAFADQDRRISRIILVPLWEILSVSYAYIKFLKVLVWQAIIFILYSLTHPLGSSFLHLINMIKITTVRV